MKTGLCSVTFREKSSAEIIELAQQAGLDGIEWGSDIHVPVSDYESAYQIADRSKEAGLEVSSYGSYFRVGVDHSDAFRQVLSTAEALGAPSVRIWAGHYSSSVVDEDYWEEIVNQTSYLADLAAEKQIALDFEYHGGTLTDSRENALTLMKRVNHRNVRLYWQPEVGASVSSCLQDISMLEAWLSHIHVFYWRGTERYPLEQGLAEWRQYLAALPDHKSDRYAMLEFVKNDDSTQFLQDAEVLHQLVTSNTLNT